MSLKSVVVVGLVGLSLAGCKETIGSEDIRTNGIAAITEVIARSDSRTRVRTELLAGGDESNTAVILRQGDRLLAEADGEEQELEEVSDGVYEAVFDTGAGGTEFTVVLERNGDDDAPGNHGILPEPFEFTSEFADPVSRSQDDIEITWEPSGEDDDMDIEITDMIDDDGCIFRFDDDIPGDTGSYVLEANALDSTGPSDDPRTCDVEVTISRTRNGSTDDALDGESSFVLKQVRTMTFTSAP